MSTAPGEKYTRPVVTTSNLIPNTASSFGEGSNTNMSITPRTKPGYYGLVLIAKYDFVAEATNELSLTAGEALKLVERKGEGWVLAKPIGRMSEKGLIPASYVRIVRLNADESGDDKEFDDEWLATKEETDISHLPEVRCGSQGGIAKKNSAQSSKGSVSDERDMHFSSSTTFSADSKKYLTNSSTSSISTVSSSYADNSAESNCVAVSGLVRNVSCFKGRYWYRVDISMSNGQKRHLCRYYQDFYKLHCSIIDKLRKSPSYTKEELKSIIEKLPTLPDPIPRPDLTTVSAVLLHRCQSLNVYIFLIVQNKYKMNYGRVLNEWMKPRLGDLESEANKPYSTDAIEELLQPFPTTVINEIIPENKTSPATHILEKPSLTLNTEFTPPCSPGQINTPRSLSLPENSSSPLIWPSPSTPPTNVVGRFDSISHSPHSSPSLRGGDIWNSSPTEPLSSKSCLSNNDNNDAGNHFFTRYATASPLQGHIKIKVFFDDEIFALRFRTSDSLASLRDSISKRLECDSKQVKLYYKRSKEDYFVPLSDDIELYNAVSSEPKLIVKVHLW